MREPLSPPSGNWKPLPPRSDLKPTPPVMSKHCHYFKPFPYRVIDPYRLLEVYEVTNPAFAHAIKKLLVAGKRGAKDTLHDVDDVIDTLKRWKEMREEDAELERLARAKVVEGEEVPDCGQ